MSTKVCLVKAMVFPVVMYGCERWTEEGWAPKNWCIWTVVLEKTLESPLDCREIQPLDQNDPNHSEGDQPWNFFERNDAKAEAPVLWPPHMKRWLIGKDSCWEGLRAGGEGDDREWDGWMASLTRWTWVWVNSCSWWWTGRPDVLQFMGSQRVGHDWANELNYLFRKHYSGFWCYSNWQHRRRKKSHLFLLIPSLVAQTVKSPSVMQETWVWFLGGEYPLEKEMVTHSLAWRTPWTEEPGRLQSTGLQRAGDNWVTNTFTFHLLILKESI